MAEPPIPSRSTSSPARQSATAARVVIIDFEPHPPTHKSEKLQLPSLITHGGQLEEWAVPHEFRRNLSLSETTRADSSDDHSDPSTLLTSPRSTSPRTASRPDRSKQTAQEIYLSLHPIINKLSPPLTQLYIKITDLLDKSKLIFPSLQRDARHWLLYYWRSVYKLMSNCLFRLDTPPAVEFNILVQYISPSNSVKKVITETFAGLLALDLTAHITDPLSEDANCLAHLERLKKQFAELKKYNHLDETEFNHAYHQLVSYLASVPPHDYMAAVPHPKIYNPLYVKLLMLLGRLSHHSVTAKITLMYEPPVAKPGMSINQLEAYVDAVCTPYQ